MHSAIILICLSNIGIPMIFISWPLMIVGLIPVIVIEWLVACRLFKSMSQVRLLQLVALANLITTLIGIPITWAMLVTIQLLTDGGGYLPIQTPFEQFVMILRQSAWILPYREELIWMIPSAQLVLLVPFLLTSYWIEKRIILNYATEANSQALARAILWATPAAY